MAWFRAPLSHMVSHGCIVVAAAVAFFFLVSASGCGVGNQFLFSAGRDLTVTPADQGLPYRNFWFSTRGGIELNGWLIPGRSNLPMVLFFHGNGGNLGDGVQYLLLLHRLGFPVCTFDYRGYGRSGGLVHREEDLYEDARGVIAYLERQGWRSADMIYYGQSLGAAVALQMALETPPSGLVMESPFTTFSDIQKHLAPLGYAMFGCWGFYARFDNRSKIRKLAVPLLLILGERDDLTPPEMARELHSAARVPRMLHVIQGGGHCDADRYGGKAYRDAWRRFAGSLTQSRLSDSS